MRDVAGEPRPPIRRTPVEERHATWLELFFDLVIVVAVAQLADLLHDHVRHRDHGGVGAAGRPRCSARRWPS